MMNLIYTFMERWYGQSCYTGQSVHYTSFWISSMVPNGFASTKSSLEPTNLLIWIDSCGYINLSRTIPNIQPTELELIIFSYLSSGYWPSAFQSNRSGNPYGMVSLPVGHQTVGKNAARSCSTGLLTRFNRTGILHPRWRSGILLHPPVTSYTPTTNTINL